MIMANNAGILGEKAKQLNALEDQVRAQTEGFFYSTPFISLEVQTPSGIKDLSLDFRDMMLISAMSEGNVLVSGRTGGGKTSVARAIQRGIFGESCAFFQMDAKFDENRFRDIAFGTIKEGGNLSDASTPGKALTAPALIIDEYNRAPPVVTNIIQGWLTNGSVTLDGERTIFPGVVIPGSGHYQWKVATVNEGIQYIGTSGIDKASRNRFAIEMPFDMFPPTDVDRRNLIAHGKFKEDSVPESVTDMSSAMFKLIRTTKEVPVDPLVTEFLLYVQKGDLCYNSPTGTKLGFDEFTLEICKGCHAAAQNKEICGMTFAPPEKSIPEVLSLARAFAIYRNYRIPESELTVSLSDMSAVMPFVMFHKIDIADGWAQKYGGGSTWYATQMVIKEMQSAWIQGTRALAPVIEAEYGEKQLSPSMQASKEEVLLSNPKVGQVSDMIQLYRKRPERLHT